LRSAQLHNRQLVALLSGRADGYVALTKNDKQEPSRVEIRLCRMSPAGSSSIAIHRRLGRGQPAVDQTDFNILRLKGGKRFELIDWY
jgi:hypothetical protein